MNEERETAREHLGNAEALLVLLIDDLAKTDMTTKLVTTLVAVRDRLQVARDLIEEVRGLTDASMSVERAVNTVWKMRSLL